jgi:polysaccharide biosynthesis transport protein
VNASLPQQAIPGTSQMVVVDAGRFDLRPQDTPYDAAENLNLRVALRRAVRGAPFLAGGILAGLALGYAALNSLPAKYTSSVSILIDPKRPDSLGADAAFANLYVDSGRVASVEQILVSSSLLGKVVDAEHLADEPSLSPARPSLFARLQAAVLDQPLVNADDANASRRARAIERLAKAIKTTRVGLTYVIKLDAVAGDPRRAQRLASDVADAYLNDQLDSKYAAARRDVAWLDSRLTQLRQSVMESEAKIEDVRQKYGLVQTDGAPGSTLDRQAMTSLNAELSEARADVAVAGAKYNQVRRLAHTGGNLEGLSAVGASKVIEDLRTQQAASNRRLADLGRRFTPAYPEYQQAKNDSDVLNRQVATEVSRIVSGVRNDYETAVARRDELGAQVKELVNTANAASHAQGRVALKEAERVADANRLAYESGLNRLRDVEQQVTRQEAEARIISRAQLPDGPSFPKPPMFLGGGAAFGLLCGMGFIVLAPKLQSKVTDPDDAKALLRLPVLAMAPALRKADLKSANTKISIPQYLETNPISQYAESLRMLRLALSNSPADVNVLQVTSSVPGEGKSTLAASIAISAAAAGKRTIIVDLDFYNPAVSRFFGEQQPEGIIEAIIGGDANRFIRRAHEILPLYVLASGSKSVPRPEMVESNSLRMLVADLSESYDLVVLDTPPVLAISDPIRISSLCGATLMVVAWSDTPRDMVHQAVTALRAAHAPLAGVVLNKVNLAKTGMYGGKTYTYKPYSSG